MPSEGSEAMKGINIVVAPMKKFAKNNPVISHISEPLSQLCKNLIRNEV